MEWQDEGIVLSASRHGEADALLDVMTKNHGRSRGFIKGGLGRRNKANLQAGNFLSVTWRSRIETNLGRFTVELIHSPIGAMMGDGARVSALAAASAVVASTMTESEPHESVYDGFHAVIRLLENEGGSVSSWAAALAKLELGILSELGYGLDLSVCASTGTDQGLVYVSPKSGRAVSLEAGKPYKGRLLDLPPFLLPDGPPDASLEDAVSAMKLTGYFLDRNVWIVRGKGQPAARERLFALLLRKT